MRALTDAIGPVAVARRTLLVAWARELMCMIKVDSKRTVADVIGTMPVEIFAGSKRAHFLEIHEKTNIPLPAMLFFDNERGNIEQVSQMGPTCVYCPQGMTEAVFREGLKRHAAEYNKKKRSAKWQEHFKVPRERRKR